MHRHGSLAAGLVLVTAAILAADSTAEIYRWVDDQGNIHFGDRPRDQDQADRAEPVEIVEQYQPTERTPAEQEAYEQEQQAHRRSREIYQQEDQEARQLEEEQARKEKAERCAALKEDIEKLTTAQLIDGVPAYYFLEDENGKSMTSARQREIVAELKQEYATAGCQ